jgi:RNA polymerase sigma factor (sigma-70 family)
LILFESQGIGRSPASDTGDAELMERVSAGDAAAFEALYTTLYPRLFRFIYRMTRDADLAEDVLNETMLVVWEKPESFDGRCKPSTWVFGIAYLKSLKACSKKPRAAAQVSLDDIAEVLPDSKPSATRQVELDDLLRVALDTLPPEQRAVVELTYYHELPCRDIAQILGCPENTVKTRMFHARRKLKPFFRDLIPEPQDYPCE